MSNSKLKVLFAPAQGMGHIGACHGLADILCQRGHDCIFILDIKCKGRLAKHCYEEAILQDIGSESHSATEPELLQKFFLKHHDDIITIPPIDVMKSIGFIFGDMFEDSKKLEVDYKAVVDAVKPDIIICDTHIASPALMNSGIPWLLLCSMAPLEFYNTCNPADMLPPSFSGLSIHGNKEEWHEFRQQLASLNGNFHKVVDEWYHSISGEHLPSNTDPAKRRNHRMDEVRGGFVLKAKSDKPPARRNSLMDKTKKGFFSVFDNSAGAFCLLW